MAPGSDEKTEIDQTWHVLSIETSAQVGKSAATIMAALILEGGVDYLAPAIAAKAREAALIAHGVEDDAPGSE